MSCSSGCSTDKTSDGGKPAGCGSSGSCATDSCNKLTVFDWLSDMQLPQGDKPFDVLEVRFKNSRKEFYKNQTSQNFQVGDVVAVEATSGHDIGVVSLSGELVRIQMKKKEINYDSAEVRKVYRKARPADIDKWREAQALEVETMYKARTLAITHGLAMKISDVEYQGDKSKAIFYYTADARVDFRELIKSMASQFGVRVEMKQIGARQEASRLGGIGSCGRELCCSTWLTDFRTVNTSAARYQQLSLNPLKLAGQCGKLKCCLNYELDSYLDAVKDFPQTDNLKLTTKQGRAFHQKTDIFKRQMWFSYEGNAQTFVQLTVDRVKQIIDWNKQGIHPEELVEEVKIKAPVQPMKHPDFENAVGKDSINRFDKKKQQGGNQQRNNPNRR
ncbi:MAG TPA: regulatory iron-sulfur-containing complex subunit RicT, partial [Bacteroidia bacterium]|nr:regulatory iron-sulfur-containing complex subunit RicT [Bacteroidia bacterium]